MKAKISIGVIGLFFCIGAHASSYVSEDLKFLKLKFQCDGETCDRQTSCTFIANENGKIITHRWKISGGTMKIISPRFKDSLDKSVDMRISNNDRELAKVSGADRESFINFQTSDPVCWTGGDLKSGEVGNFIWCSQNGGWPKRMVAFLVGMAAIPILLIKEGD